MIKRIILLQAILLLSFFTKASVGDWTLYPAYHDVTYCEIAGDKVYILASGALFSFNTKDNEITTYDKLNSLSDVDITHIAYSDYLNALIVIYSNANIDILYDDGYVYNITDFKNSNIASKKINNISVINNSAFLSTEFGVVVLDLEKLEFKNTYSTGHNTLCTYLFKDKLYTGTSDGLFKCDTVKNMLDKNNWEKINNNVVDALCELDDKLYTLVKSTGIHTLNNDTYKLTNVVARNGEKYHTIYTTKDNEIIAPAKDKITIINEDGINTYTTSNCNHISKQGDIFWNCKGFGGFYKCKAEDKTIVETLEVTKPNSPIRNFCEFMKFTNDDKLIVTGGNINYFGLTANNKDGTLMQYDINNHKWLNFPEDEIKEITKLKYLNICSADEDPTEPGHIFASSFGHGLFEFRNGEFVQHYDFNNSALETAVKNNRDYIRVPEVIFDNEGNLWCINTTNIADIVKVLKKNGEWISLNYKEIEWKETMVKPMFDSRGWLWITSLDNGAGLFCAKLMNTPFDVSDDKTKTWFEKFTNQDGTTYDIYQVPTLCEDKNKTIWVGTDKGLFIIDNPEEFFNNGIFKQIKIPRNDGTGLADYLMNGIYIKAIDIDAANRKWIGTLDNGVMLISEDGLETIHHFTTENSPLPSNYIESIAINHKTGEVFIGTDKGIVSYKSDAIRTEENLEKSRIHAYPNPVRSNYNGNISIVGLTDECNVKIVDGAGYLVNEGTSKGGMYTWNGRNKNGEKVSSGVYKVLLYDKNGKEGETTKIVVTR